MIKTAHNDGVQFHEKRFTKIDLIKTRYTNVFILNFLPNQKMRQHAHPGKDLSLHVLQGSGTLFTDDQKINVKVGDIIYCEAHEAVGFLNNDTEKNIYSRCPQ